MFDNFTRAALLNAPPGMVLTAFVATPIQPSNAGAARHDAVGFEAQSAPTQTSTVRPKRWRFPRFGLSFGASA